MRSWPNTGPVISVTGSAAATSGCLGAPQPVEAYSGAVQRRVRPARPCVRRRSSARGSMPRSPPRAPGRRRCTWPPGPSRRRAAAAGRRASPSSRAPEPPSGWPMAMAPPLGLTIDRVELRPLGQARQRLGGERLVELDRRPGRPSRSRPAAAPCSAASHRADAVQLRVDRARRAAGDPRQRRAVGSSPRRASSSAAAPSFIGEALPAVTVPSLRNTGFSLRELLERGVGADALVARRARRPGPARPRRRTRRAPRRPRPAGGCAARTRPAPRGRSRTCRPGSRRPRRARPSTRRGIPGLTIRQPSVVECMRLVRARERLLGLGQHPRRAAHRLDAAGDARRPRRRRRSRGWRRSRPPVPEPHSRFTVAPGHRGRQPGQQHRHAGDVAVVLAGLVGVAEVDLVDPGRVEPGCARPAPAPRCAARSSGRTPASAPP